MTTVSTKVRVFFESGDTECAAWHYHGTNGACVVMAGGGAVTKEPGTDRFAERFNDAGFSVLAFDYRRLGESGGEPRQIVRMGEEQADWQAAIDFARMLPGVDPSKVALWGFSLSGGHIFPVAARNPGVAAAIAQSPLADAPAVTPKAMKYQSPLASLRLMGRGVLDWVGGVFGRAPLLVPLVGERGSVAMLSTPDAQDGPHALNPDNRYSDWQQEIAARSVLRIGFYRPGRYASRIEAPLLVLAYDDDTTAFPGPAARAAERAPRGELVRRPGGHYEPFLGGHEEAVEIELAFLRRHVLGG
jgi:pimeloyl-ACP methyl ester carboxylesterase